MTKRPGKKTAVSPSLLVAHRKGNGARGGGLALRKQTAVAKGKYTMFAKLFFEGPLQFIWRIVEAFGYYAEWDTNGRFYLARLSSLEEEAE